MGGGCVCVCGGGGGAGPGERLKIDLHAVYRIDIYRSGAVERG